MEDSQRLPDETDRKASIIEKAKRAAEARGDAISTEDLKTKYTELVRVCFMEMYKVGIAPPIAAQVFYMQIDRLAWTELGAYKDPSDPLGDWPWKDEHDSMILLSRARKPYYWGYRAFWVSMRAADILEERHDGAGPRNMKSSVAYHGPDPDIAKTVVERYTSAMAGMGYGLDLDISMDIV